MIKLYGKPSDRSYIQAKNWFQVNNLPFIERNILSGSLTLPEIKDLFRPSDNGTEDIRTTRSIKYKKNTIDIEQLSLKELYSIIQKKPRLLKSPIIHDGKRFLVGYHESQIRRFLPRTVRHYNYMELIKMEEERFLL